MKNSNIQWIGAIPDSWGIRKVKQCFYISKEQAHKKNPLVLSLARSSVKIRDISTNEGQLAVSYDNYNPVQPGDILLNPMDLYSGANCNMSEIEGVISPAYVNLRKKELLNPKFFDYYFKVQYWTMAMFAHGKGVSFDNRWTMNSDAILNYYLPYPSLEEQNIIVECISKRTAKIDRLIEIENQQIEKLKEYKQAVITEAVTKGLDKSAPMKDSGVEWIGEIPENWEVCRVKNIGFTQNGISKSGELFGNGYPFISYGDVYKHWVLPQTGSGLIESTEKDRKIFSVNKGDIFFTRTSETIEEVGFSSVCFETITNATFAGFLIRLRPYQPDSIIKSNYAKYYFRANLLRKYLVREMNIVTRASLSQELLGAMSVVLPPPNTQIEISLHLDSQCKKIDSLISIKQKKIDMLNEYKKSLIYEYVTGKKEVV